MPDGTPLRNVRVETDLWQQAKDKATAEGETVSDVVRRALREYVTN